MQLFIGKMPKLVLMTRVLPFLDEDEINKLAGVCKGIRKLIFSPMGLKIIVFNRSRRMAEYFRDNVMAKASFQHVTSESDRSFNKRDLEKIQQVRALHQYAVESLKEDQSEEINTLRNVKKFLTLKLAQNQATLESMQHELVTANELLQKERRENRDIKEELSKMEEIRESNKEIVKEMNLKYANIVAALDPDKRKRAEPVGPQARERPAEGAQGAAGERKGRPEERDQQDEPAARTLLRDSGEDQELFLPDRSDEPAAALGRSKLHVGQYQVV